MTDTKGKAFRRDEYVGYRRPPKSSQFVKGRSGNPRGRPRRPRTVAASVFGDSEFAVRLSAPLLHAGAAVFVYGIGARLYDQRVGFWSALTYANLPGVSVSAFIISTDAPLMFFWAAALYAFVRAREEGGWGWWLAVGHLVTGVLLCLTIIGIPLGLANFKIIPVTLVPLGGQIVPERDY